MVDLPMLIGQPLDQGSLMRTMRTASPLDSGNLLGLNRVTSSNGLAMAAMGAMAATALSSSGNNPMEGLFNGGQNQQNQYQQPSNGSQGFSNQPGQNYGAPQGYGAQQGGFGAQQGGYNQSSGSYGAQGYNQSTNTMPQNFGGQPQQNFGGQPQQNFGGQSQQNFGGQPQQNFGGQPQQNFGGQPQQNFGGQPQQNFGGQPQPAPVPQSAPTPQPAPAAGDIDPAKVRPMPTPQLKNMARKGQKLALENGTKLTSVKAALGWNVNNDRCDLDVSAFLLGGDGKVPGDDWFVFYGQETSPDGSTVFSMAQNTDRELISVDLTRLDPRVTKIVFVLTINDALENNLNFSMVRDAYVRILDGSNNEIVSFMLDEYYPNVTSMMLGELYNHKGAWKFNAIGNGITADLAGLCARFGVQVDS